ncbi:hypothetical protein EYF80_022422 [Liparis tanakae]|uniref:Uncharacterized protein n=1 Tax=Liparis tanakae TaxID=230148 RepID=A0A4Z2HPY5_9TELE|nr:hypothetical protein EYF80_022422 [Liparis tanakae]
MFNQIEDENRKSASGRNEVFSPAVALSKRGFGEMRYGKREREGERKTKCSVYCVELRAVCRSGWESLLAFTLSRTEIAMSANVTEAKSGPQTTPIKQLPRYQVPAGLFAKRVDAHKAPFTCRVQLTGH